MNKRLIIVLDCISLIAMILVNILAMSGIVFTYTTKEISDMYTNLLVPVGITFSIIWSIIYIMLIVYTVYALIDTRNSHINKIGLLFFYTNILNMLWLVTFGMRLMLISCFVMIGLFVALYLIVNEVNRYDDLIVKTTFNIYFGWITVAMIVNIFMYVSYLNIDYYNSDLMITASCLSVLALMIVCMYNISNSVYVYTILFAMFGILVKHLYEYENAYPLITLFIIVSILVIILSKVLTVTSRRKYKKVEA